MNHLSYKKSLEAWAKDSTVQYSESKVPFPRKHPVPRLASRLFR